MAIKNSNLEDSAVWSMYWSGGQRDSCLAVKSEEHQQQLHAYWLSVVDNLSENARVLDLACGNGAVAHVLNNARPDLWIDAVDKSDLNPLINKESAADCNKQQSRLCFYSNTDLLELPETLSGYDLICSQFGIEYAGLASIPLAIHNRLNKQGRLAFLIHHQEGGLVSSTTAKLEEYRVLNSFKLFTLLEARISAGESNNQRNRNLADQNLESAGQAYMALGTGTMPISGSVFNVISEILKLADKNSAQALEQLNQVILRVNAEQSRLQQMLASARSQRQIKQFDTLLAKQGFVDRNARDFLVDVDSAKYLLAWNYQASLSS